jgi:hypothetical protein
LAEGITEEDRNVRKEAGAKPYNTDHVAGAPTFTGTWSAGRFWTGAMALYAVDNLTPFVRVVGNATGSAGPTTPYGPTAGTGTIHSGGTTVTSASIATAFTTQLHVGDFITAAGQTRQVQSIQSNSQLTTFTAFSPALSGNNAFTFQSAPRTQISVGAPVIAGHTIVIGMTVWGGATNANPATKTQFVTTDTQGNTYTQTVTDNPNNPTLSTVIITGQITTALGPADKINIVNATPFVNISASAVEYTAAVLQQTGTANGTISGMHAGTAVSFTANSALTLPILIVGIASALDDPSTVTWAPGSGFTARQEVLAAQPHPGMDLLANQVEFNDRVQTTQPTIIALFDFHSFKDTLGPGTVTTVSGSRTVNGAGTTFNGSPDNGLVGFRIGDIIEVNGERRYVKEIISATQLTTTDPWTLSNAGQAYHIIVNQRLITASTDGNIYKDKPTGEDTGELVGTIIFTGLNQSVQQGRFVQGGSEIATNPRKLFFANGIDAPEVLTGNDVTMHMIAKPPLDWTTPTINPGNQPINFVVHANRMVGFGNENFPHAIYMSTPSDHEDFQTSTGDPNASTLVFTIPSRVGLRLMAGANYNGVLYLWEYPRGLYYLDDSNGDAFTWTVHTTSQALGCAQSQYAVLPCDTDVLFLTASGEIHALSAVNTLGGTLSSDLGYKLGVARFLRNNLNLKRLNQCVSVWYPFKRIATFSLPAVGSEVNNLTIHFDFGNLDIGGLPRFHYSFRDTPTAYAIRQTQADFIDKPIFGESSTVFLTEQVARNKDGTAYNSIIQTSHNDMGGVRQVNAPFGSASVYRTRRKVWRNVEFIMEPVAAGTATVEVLVDRLLRQTLTVDCTVRRQRFTLMCGDGYTISFNWQVNGLDQDYKLLAIYVGFEVGQEDTARAVGEPPPGPTGPTGPQISWLLTTTTSGTGTGSVSPPGGTFADGTVVTLTATPGDADSEFVMWTGDLTGSTNPDSITMNSDKTVNAVFNLKPLLSISESGTGTGVVTSDV